MVDNKGNAYRTRGALTLGIVIIGLAVMILAYFAAKLSLTVSFGVFLLIMGVALLVMSPGYTSAPDKFGPGERDYRVAMGALIVIIGAVLVLTTFNLDWYWYVAIVIIGVAVLGMAMAVVNSKKINNE